MSFLSQYDSFHELATKATGLDDFGPGDYIEPMKLVLSDYDKYAHFSETGIQMVSASFVGLLVGRLFAQQGFKSHPQFANAPVERPIIIVGMLRTGSTALLQLLSKDPGNQWLPPWLGATPIPRPPRDTWEDNPWYQQMAQGLAQINQMNPDLKQAHPMLPDMPDECRFGYDQSFWSPGLAVTASTREYAEWCISTDARYAYRRYKQILGLIGGGSAQRWLLKDPSHLWGLDALLDVFPDACIVYTHRDPVDAVTSMASLIYELRRLTEPLPREKIGRELLARWGRAQAKAETARERHDPSRFFDVHIKELQADPIATAERIYHHFNIRVTEHARTAWHQHISSDVKAGRSPKKIAPEDMGFTPEEVYSNVGGYYERYQRLYAKPARP